MASFTKEQEVYFEETLESFISATFSAATATRVLVAFVSVNKDAGPFFAADEPGWNLEVSNNNSQVSCAIYWKVAAGGETVVTPNFTNEQNSSIVVQEWSGFVGTPFVSVKSSNYDGGSVSSINTGTTAATTNASALALAVMASDTSSASPSLTNGYTLERYENGTDNGIAVASLELTATGTTNTTFSWSGSTDQLAAAIIVIEDVAGVAGAPIIDTLSPADDATGVSTSPTLVITFNENVVSAGVGNLVIRRDSDNGVVALIPIDDTDYVTFLGSSVTIVPPVQLSQNELYYVEVPEGAIVDVDEGLEFAGFTGNATWKFTTTAAAAGIEFKGVETSTTSDPTLSVPANAEAGDLQIVGVATSQDTTIITPPSGWNLFVGTNPPQSFVGGSPSSRPAIVLYWRYLQNGDGADLWDMSTSDGVVAFRAAWSNVASPPIEPVFNPQGSATPAVAPSTTTTEDNSVAVYIALKDATGLFTLSTGGATERFTLQGGGSGLALAMADKVVPTAGSSGTQEWTLAAQETLGITIILEPNVASAEAGAPTLVSTVPVDDAVDVQRQFFTTRLTFNEPVSADTGNITLRRDSDDSIVEQLAATDARVVYSSAEVIVHWETTLGSQVLYYIEVDSDAFQDVDESNNFAGFTGNATLKFTSALIPPQNVSYVLMGGITHNSAKMLIRLVAGSDPITGTLFEPTITESLTAGASVTDTVLAFDTSSFSENDLVAVVEESYLSWHTITSLTGTQATVTPAVGFAHTTSATVYRITGVTPIVSPVGSTQRKRGQVLFTGLTANTRYFGFAENTPPSGFGSPLGTTFLTHQTPGAPVSYRMLFASCCNIDEAPVWPHMLARPGVRCVEFTGDLAYIDQSPTYDVSNFEELVDDRLGVDGPSGQLARSVVVGYQTDDHEAANDYDSTFPEIPFLQAAYRYAFPSYDLPSTTELATFQHSVNGRVMTIRCDARNERDPAATTPDTIDKKVFSDEQWTWLNARFAEASANGYFILLVLTYPVVADAAGGSDTWGGYTFERTKLWDAIASNNVGTQTCVISGDAHMNAIRRSSPDYSTGAQGVTLPVLQGAAMASSPSTKGGDWDIELPGTEQFMDVLITDSGGSTLSLWVEGRQNGAIRDDGGGLTINEEVVLTLSSAASSSSSAIFFSFNF